MAGEILRTMVIILLTSAKWYETSCLVMVQRPFHIIQSFSRRWEND